MSAGVSDDTEEFNLKGGGDSAQFLAGASLKMTSLGGMQRVVGCETCFVKGDLR
jgi:hypothetical protein